MMGKLLMSLDSNIVRDSNNWWNNYSADAVINLVENDIIAVV